MGEGDGSSAGTSSGSIFLGMMKLILVAVVLLQALGCAYYKQRNPLPKVSLPPLSDGAKQFNLKYSFSYKGPLNFAKGYSTDMSDYKIESLVVLKDTGYFANLANEDQNEVPGLQTIAIDAQLFNDHEGLVRDFVRTYTFILCVGSFGMIPAWTTDTFTLSAKVKTHHDKEYSYQVEDSVTEYCWLPVVLFWERHIINERDIRMNMWENMILKMQKDGLFKQTQ